MDKENWYIHTMEYYIASREIQSFSAVWMNLDDIVLNEKKSNTERQNPHDLPFLGDLK
jgi:hypothetical protein